MPQATKEIKRRIRSIGNTKKITKAMELVSAAKMRRAVQATLSGRAYARYAWNLLVNMAETTDRNKHPLLKVRPVKRVAMVFITSNKGLCGGFNLQIARKMLEQIKNPEQLMINRVLNQKIETKVKKEDLEIDFIAVGKKGVDILNKTNSNLIASFTDISDTPKLKDTLPISNIIINDYIDGKYDKVVVAYTDYVSAIKQEPKFRQLLPISILDLEKLINDLDTDINKYEEELHQKFDVNEYLLEPSAQEVLEVALKRLVEMQIYQTVLESAASEHSARMMAMRNATDAADEMSKELTLLYNKARQASITQEISEISAGKIALDK